MVSKYYPTKKALKEAEVEKIAAAIPGFEKKLKERAVSRDYYDRDAVSAFTSVVGDPWSRNGNNLEFRTGKDEYLPKRFVSVEIELNSCKAGHTKEYAAAWAKIFASCSAVKGDGSVSGDGIELNTMPAKGAIFHKQMDMIKEAFIELEAQANKTCGLHVHVDCRDLTGAQLFKVANVWCRVESEMMELITKTRRTNNYCRPFSNETKEKWLSKKFIKDTKLDSEKNMRRIERAFGGDRYKTLNMYSAYYSHKTVEFRMHHGSSNAEVIRNWAILCSEIVNYGAKCTMSQSRNVTLDKIAASTKLKKFIAEKRELMKGAATTEEVENVFAF